MKQHDETIVALGVGVTRFFTIYFKFHGKDISFWQNRNFVNVPGSLVKPLFKNNYMRLFVDSTPTEMFSSISELDKLNLVIGPAHAIRYRYFNKAFSKNQDDLAAYYALRKYIYKQAYGYYVSVNEYDKPSSILIVKKENKVIGGARLVICDPHSDNKLPIEKHHLDLVTILPDLYQYKRCELGRLCLIISERKSRVSLELIDRALKEGLRLGCRYVITTSSINLLGFYRQLFAQIGYKFMTTALKITIQADNEPLDLQIAVIDLHDYTLTKRKLSHHEEKMTAYSVSARL